MCGNIDWYIIPKNISHDPGKQYCFGWEFQPDKYEVLLDIQSKMGISTDLCDFINKGMYTDKWCPKCHMFAVGISATSPVCVAHHGISHSYANDAIWMSDWNVGKVLLGSYHTPFIKLFRADMMYSEVFQVDVAGARFDLRCKGAPLRTSDKYAHDEANIALDFIEKWTKGNDTYHVIMRKSM